MSSESNDHRVMATVYSYWDDERSTWRHTLTERDRAADETHEVLLPEGFDLYETVGGETFAYRTWTEPHKQNQSHDAWKVVPYRDGFALAEVWGLSRHFMALETV